MVLRGWIKDRKEELLDLIFPKTCFGCKKRLSPIAEIYICPLCLNKICKLQPPFCKTCGRPVEPLSERCPDCTGQNFYFSRGFTSNLYEGLIKDCIHNFKYNSYTYLGGTLAFFMADFAKRYIDIDKIDAIASIPLHWQRKRDRGFNQSAILAEILSKNFRIPYTSTGLSRIKSIQPQVELPRKERISNVLDVFKVKNPKKILDKRILLIDDVFTTGATFNECSRVLMECGAKDVWVFSLARGISA